jgi:hypothetical protein
MLICKFDRTLLGQSAAQIADGSHVVFGLMPDPSRMSFAFSPVLGKNQIHRLLHRLGQQSRSILALRHIVIEPG